MKVLIDSNVILDVILKNPGLADGSKAVFDHATEERFTGYVSASAVTDIFFIARKRLGKDATKEAIKHILAIYRVATVTDKDIYKALDLTWDDFEDSVQFTVGEALSADYIITRNIQDFSSGSIPTVTPEQFMQIINPPLEGA